MPMLKPGDVVLVMFRYSDFSGAKHRPAVVVSSETYNKETRHVVLAAVSTRPLVDHFDVPIGQWEFAGLHFPSKVRVGRILTVDAGLARQIGRLNRTDFKQAQLALSQVFV